MEERRRHQHERPSGALAGSPDRLQETSVERRALNSTSGHCGDLILEVLCLEPFCSPTYS